MLTSVNSLGYNVFTKVNNLECEWKNIYIEQKAGEHMDANRINLTTAEWNVMEGLWEKECMTGREATELLEERMGWNRSTTLTLLRRMEEKGAISSQTEGAKKVFRPLISREDAALQETEDFLERVYKGSVSMMLSAMTKKQALSKAEINELYDMLKELEDSAE